jgi:DNA-binding CsgD family transcriptional regulator
VTEAEQISSLIGEIYDAALDPALWPAVQEKICAFVRGRAAGLYWQDPAIRTGRLYYQCGVQPSYERLYFDKYIRMDPIAPALMFLGVGETLCVPDVMSHEEFRKTRFYREWMRPQGFLDGVLANLDKSATSSAVFITLRHQDQGLVDDEMRRCVRLIIPHVRRAALIGKVIDLHKAEAATLADTLDGIASGMILVDATARITHANASAHVLLTRGDVLRALGGRLASSDAQTNQVFKDVFAAAGNGDMAVGVKGIAVPLRSRDGDRYVAHVLPLTSGNRRRAGVTYAAVAAVFVRKAGLEAPSPPETLAQLYQLTPSEVRVLLAVVEVGGVPEVADMLGIAQTTAKTHLRHLFAKTGTRRQADLVKLVAGYSSALFR